MALFVFILHTRLDPLKGLSGSLFLYSSFSGSRTYDNASQPQRALTDFPPGEFLNHQSYNTGPRSRAFPFHSKCELTSLQHPSGPLNPRPWNPLTSLPPPAEPAFPSLDHGTPVTLVSWLFLKGSSPTPAQDVVLLFPL